MRSGLICSISHSKLKCYSNKCEKYFFKSNASKRKAPEFESNYSNIRNAKIGRQKRRPKKQKKAK